MNLSDNNQEYKAIQQLEKAFKKCSELGIKFSVMDADLLYANKRLYKACLDIERKKEKRTSGLYPTIAYSCETDMKYSCSVNCSGSMESCGGW